MTLEKAYVMTWQRFAANLLIYFLLAMAALCICPFIGTESLSLNTIINDLRTDTWSTDTEIFLNIRIPRVLLGFLAGGTLALVGACFQVILKNPLATPYTLGVMGGAAVGAYIAIAFDVLAVSFGPFSTVQLFAFTGAGVTMVIIYLISRRTEGISTTTLLLAGVTIGIICGAAILLIRYISKPDLLVSMDRWTMGSADTVGFRDISVILVPVVIGLGLILQHTNALNALSLGEEMAGGFGVEVAKVQFFVFFGGSLAVAAVVSVTGPIGFIGLLVPHIIRRLSGFDSRIVLPGSFLTGAALLCICDGFARTIVAPTEMPVGIITAIVGGPFFIALLIRKR